MSLAMRVPASVPVLLIGAALLLTACQRADRAPARANRADVPTALPLAAPADTAAAADLVTMTRAPAGIVGGRPAAVGSVSPESKEASISATTQQEVTPGSMLVRVGQASLQVDSLEVGITRLRDVARRTNAVIANTSMAGGRDETRAATIELRVPSERFDEAVNGLSPIGKVESVNVSVQDVGEEYVDIQARVANARRLEQRLVELLANRTGKLSDVLSVERELARVREEIERYEGRMRYLRTRASISTLSVSLHEPFPIVAEHPGAHPIGDAFIQAWRNLVGVTAAIIASLGVIVPLGVIVTALVLVGRRALPTRAFRLPKSTSAGNA